MTHVELKTIDLGARVQEKQHFRAGETRLKRAVDSRSGCPVGCIKTSDTKVKLASAVSCLNTLYSFTTQRRARVFRVNWSLLKQMITYFQPSSCEWDRKISGKIEQGMLWFWLGGREHQWRRQWPRSCERVLAWPIWQTEWPLFICLSSTAVIKPRLLCTNKISSWCYCRAPSDADVTLFCIIFLWFEILAGSS